MVSSAPKEMFKEGQIQKPHPTPPPPKENKGTHIKKRPHAYDPHKEKKSPPHGEKGPHNVNKNPHEKNFSRERRKPTDEPPPPCAPMYGTKFALNNLTHAV